MTCLQLANQIGLFFSSTTHCELTFIVSMPQSGCFIIQLPRRVLRVYWLGYLPGSVFRERVSGASSLVCTGLYGRDPPTIPHASLSCKLSRAEKFKSFILKIRFLQTEAFLFVQTGLEMKFN